MTISNPFELPISSDELIVKECGKALAYEPHPEHTWEKREREFRCEGIPELVDQPPCLIYISPEEPVCGKPAPAKIRVRTKLVNTRVPACVAHKAEYDHHAALVRAAHASRNAVPNQRAS